MIIKYEFGDYAPDDDELDNFVTQEFAEQYGLFRDIAQEIISDYDLWDNVYNNYYDEIYYYFRDRAKEYYYNRTEQWNNYWEDYE